MFRFLKQKIGETLLKSLGWKIIGHAPKSGKQVIIAAPHTSNYDFVYLVACAWAMRADAAWLGKEEIFKYPGFRWFFKKIGGIPIKRSQAGGYVEKLSQFVESKSHINLCIPPEGTRGKAPGWRTGFYHIANSLNLPIMMAFIDYKNKELGLSSEVVQPTGDIEKDFVKIRNFYENIRGRYPAKESPVYPIIKKTN